MAPLLVANRASIAQREEVAGLENSDMLMSKEDLARVLTKQGKYEEAEMLYRDVLAKRIEALGSEHSETTATKKELALMLDLQGMSEQAEAMHT